MISFIAGKIKKYLEFILAGFLWLCIWATYNDDISRIFAPGFPHNTLDLIHGIRVFFPFVAIFMALFFLYRNKKITKGFFLTPLGLLGIYTIIGIISSLLFSREPLSALYWGVLYGSVIIVLLSILSGPESLQKLSFIININWAIAGMITLGLVSIFVAHPGAVSSLTNNILVCNQRPFEGMGGVRAQVPILDMAGSRATGLGRYAGLIAIVAFAYFLCAKNKLKSKFIWFVSFILFLSFLIFSKGRTEIIGFLAAMVLAVWLAKKINLKSFLGMCLVFIIGIIPVFYSIPCVDYNLSDFVPRFLAVRFSAPPVVNHGAPPVVNHGAPPVIAPPVVSPSIISAITLKTNIYTLSGRTTGVWTDSWHLFLKNPLLGFGFQADRFFIDGQHAHDSLLHALIQSGILGTIPFILAFILIFSILVRLFNNSQVKQKERNFLIILSAVLVFFAARSITESVAYFSADWLFVAPIIVYIQCLDGEMKRGQNGLVMNFCGNKINLLKISDVIEKIKYWIKNESQKLHWVVVTGMHGIVESEKHPSFKYIISNADMFVPDGISLVWLAKLKGFDIKKRISGADLMQEVLKISSEQGFKNYFYGDTEETLKIISRKFPDVKTDFYSPPFRELTQEEDQRIIEKINQTKPDVLWVGLGLPKQEKWIFEHREKLNVPVVIGVGAAFKFLSGNVKRAPKWVGDAGFEWLWRFVKEPKTTWKRVFFDIPIFFWLVIKDFVK